MRVFICSLGNISMAIPIDLISHIILFNGKTEKAVDYNSENGNTYFSLPLFFNYPSEKIKHGIILKSSENSDAGEILKNKTILLTTEIEREIEIQDEKIFPVQKTLNHTQFSLLFKGLLFDSENQRMENIILVLNPDYFLLTYQGGTENDKNADC